MWSNVISIDKGCEKEIEYILASLQSTNDLSYATEESRDRLFIYLASACENVYEIEKRLYAIAETVILTFFKTRFFEERLTFKRKGHAECALLSSIVHFDRDFEGSIVKKALSKTMDFNLDGLALFRLGALVDSWRELAEVAARLTEGASSESELYDIAAFITGSDGGKNQLLVERGRLKNLTCHKNVEVVDIFENYEYNLLNAILGERPLEILVDRGALSNPMCATLRHIARVIEK